MAYNCSPTTWKRFRDDVFVFWTHGSAALSLFLDYLNNLDDTGKIKLTMQIAEENGLEFLDLKLKIVEGKVNVDVYSKPTNSFTYVLPSTCYPYKNIRNIPKGIALRLRRICDNDEKYNQRYSEYQNYLIGRKYNPTSFTSYNPSLRCMNTLIKKHLPQLHSDDNLKILFPTETFNFVYRRNKNLKELLTPSLFPIPKREKYSCVISRNTCDIC